MICDNLLKKYPLTKTAFNYINRQFLLYGRTYQYILDNFDENFLTFSEELISNIKKIDKINQENTRGLDALIKLSREYLVLQSNLVKTGAYASSSYSKVLDAVYLNDTVMGPYMEGLLYSQIFWPN